MSNELTTVDHNVGGEIATPSVDEEYVTMTIAGQLFGIRVLTVHDVLGPQKITKVPLAPSEVAGVLNLRGRIVTAISVRNALGLPDGEGAGMSVVVEHEEESYSLLIDQVGEVLKVPHDAYEQCPATLDARWRELATGVFRLDGELMVVLDVAKLLDFGLNKNAA